MGNLAASGVTWAPSLSESLRACSASPSLTAATISWARSGVLMRLAPEPG